MDVVGVVVGPKMTPFQMDPTLRLGERLTLTCAVTAGDLPLAMSWLVDGAAVTAASSSSRSVATSLQVKTLQIDAFTSILSVDTVQLTNSGNYSCVVRNAAATLTQSQLVLIRGRRPRPRPRHR